MHKGLPSLSLTLTCCSDAEQNESANLQESYNNVPRGKSWTAFKVGQC